MKALSLFSGIGGLDLAAEACGIKTVAFCEIEEFPVSILKKRWSDVPIYDDVRKIKGDEFIERLGTVDVVHGGFPCQDLSVAGKRAGLVCGGGYTRSGLWYEMLRIISELRPRFVVGENVRGAISLALDKVQRGLETENYEVRTFLIPASAIGAPHQRERIFVLGIRKDVLEIEGEYRERSEGNRLGDTNSALFQGSREPRVLRKAQVESGLASQVPGTVWRTPDANMTRGAISEEKYIEREQRGMPNALNYQVAHEERNWPTVTTKTSRGERTGQYQHNKNHSAHLINIVEANDKNNRKGQLNPCWVEQLMGYPDGWTDPDCDAPTPWMGWPARPGEAQHEWEHPRTIVGLPHRAKRLKALGNAVVPQQAEPIFRAIQFINRMIGKDGVKYE